MSTIPSQTATQKIQIPVSVLKRLISLAGHVALRQLDHLDRSGCCCCLCYVVFVVFFVVLFVVVFVIVVVVVIFTIG